MKATFWRMNDTPIAVISGTRRGAPRSGLYATRSIVALSKPHPTIATASATRIAGSERRQRRVLTLQVEDAGSRTSP